MTEKSTEFCLKYATKNKKICTCLLVNSLHEPQEAVQDQHKPAIQVKIDKFMHILTCTTSLLLK